jgi:20S proteasome alpha/beta subunit
MTCHDCLLFCADREETTEFGGKRSVSKIHTAGSDGWEMAIATSGSGPVGDVAALRLIERAKGCKEFLSNQEPLLSQVMLEIYEQYIFPRDEQRQKERSISLIIGLVNRESGEMFLYKTYDEILKPTPHYACAGAGLDIAYYFLDRLHGDGLPFHEAQILTAFILREAKSSVGGVGGGSEFVVIFTSADNRGISLRTLLGEVIDWREIPRLNECLKEFWRGSKLLTSQKSEPAR